MAAASFFFDNYRQKNVNKTSDMHNVFDIVVEKRQ